MALHSCGTWATSDEDKNGSLLFLKGLPISDTDIVLSKFVSTFAVTVLIMAFLGFVALLGEWFIVLRLGPEVPIVPSSDITTLLRGSLYTMAALFGVSMIMLAIYLSMFFCLGYAKAEAYNRFVMLGIFAVVFAGTSVISRSVPGAGA